MSTAKHKLRTAVAAVAVSALTLGFAVACSKPKAERAATTSAASTAAASAASTSAKTEAKTTSGVVTTDVDMSQYEKGKVVRVWIPIAQDFPHQKVTDVNYKADGATKAEITTDSAGNKELYVEWGADVDPATRKAEVSFHAEREEVTRPEFKSEEGATIPDDVKPYLEGSKMVPSNNQQVTDAANEIVKGKTTDLEKARAIYDWIIANMNRDESVAGCGQGDVCALLSTKAGKCTDINSVFVGLCRAVGIPAREMFGVRMNADDITKNQHCWAEFYLKGTGWVAADPADVLKAVLKNKWTKDQAETKEKAEYFWGGYDSERVQLTYGRDVELSPKQAGAALNDFGYPYAEVDGDALDYYDPENFVYTMSFKKDA